MPPTQQRITLPPRVCVPDAVCYACLSTGLGPHSPPQRRARLVQPRTYDTVLLSLRGLSVWL